MHNFFHFYVLPPLLVLGVGFIVLILVYLVTAGLRTTRQVRLKVFSIGISIFLSLAATELFLRVAGVMATYMEKRTGYYWSPFDYNRSNVLWNRDSGQVYQLKSAEFSYPRVANSLGFLDQEFTAAKDTNEVKILCLGDSFTEGDGAPSDSCYPRQMEKLLRLQYPNRKITVMNAGICGSDPFFGYKIYDSLMYRFSPDIIIQSFAKQDVYEDMAFRGGFDRFTEEGKLDFTHRFKFEKLYRYSYLSRLYFDVIKGGNLLFINQSDLKRKQPYFKAQLKLLLDKWQAVVEQKKCVVFFVLRPDEYDMQHTEYDQLYKGIVELLQAESGQVKVVDLRPYYMDRVKMPENFSKYFWQKDGHHTSAGYYYMAQGTAKAIADFLPKKPR